MSGEWLERNPSLAGEILLKGHEIGNTPISGGSLLYFDEKNLTREIREFNRLARELLEYRPRLFRPPFGEYGALMEQVARQEGYILVLGTSESYDWLGRDITVMRRQVLEKARGGSIITFCVGSPRLAEALPGIIVSLREQGFEPVTLSRLL